MRTTHNLQRTTEIVRSIQGTERPEGQPLHQYTIDDALLNELETDLAARLLEYDLNLNRIESAAFVIYCAHHFAQSYAGGHWTWAIAKGTIDPSNRLTPPVLYDIVERGLQAWGRCVYWNGRSHEYLYTVGREGGLPLGVLARERGEGLRTFLQQLLTRIETTTISADEAASELQNHLPPQLRQPEILRLAAELVQQLAELRATVARDVAPSISWMDAHQPGWRDRLPVRASDAVAAALISGLMQQHRPQLRDQRLVLVTQFINGRLQRVLQMPKRVKLQELLGAETNGWPSRLRLAVSNGVTHSARAMATAVGDGDYVIERLAAEPLYGAAWFSNEVRLTVGVGERELTSLPLPGGEADCEAGLPWVFDTTTGGMWQLAARGSYNSKSERLLVAYRPDAGELTATAGGLEDLRPDPVLGWQVASVQGAALWQSDQDTCEIAGGAAASTSQFELTGRSERLAGTGSFVWRGCPDVCIRSQAGLSSRVPSRQIEWRSTGSQLPWKSIGRSCLGDVQLRVREEGRTLYRARLTVVPPDLRVELAADLATAGRVRVHSAFVSDASIVTRDVETTTQREATGVTLAVRSATPPANLEVSVQLGETGRLSLHIPFPSEFCGFVCVDGTPLPNKGRISVDSLTRWMARAVSCDAAQTYVLEAKTGDGVRHLAELPAVARGVSELPLSRISSALEACLSGTRSIDASVLLRVTRRVGIVTAALTRCEARLGWHDAQLEVFADTESAAVQLPSGLIEQLEDWQVSDFRVIARPLYAPATAPHVLEGNAPSGWFFSPSGERSWLLTGWIGNALVTRPRLVQFDAPPTLAPESAAAQPLCLDSAMRLPSIEERRQALAEVYGDLALDYAHDDWTRVDDFLRTLHELPPPTYDVVCALAASKAAAIAALFRQPPAHFEVVWNALEQLGVSWHTVPLGLWLRAATLARDFTFGSPHADLFGGKEGFLKQMLPGLFEQVQHGPRFFSVLMGAMNAYRTGFPLEPQAGQLLQSARCQEGRALLRQQLHSACIDLRLRAELTGDRFPPVRLSNHECCPDSRALLEYFGLADQAAYTWECIAAPLVAADIMINARAMTAPFLDDLRLLRSFDDEWFEFAHAVALTVLLGKKLENDVDFFERAESELLGTNC
jgi:hypothetical protein